MPPEAVVLDTNAVVIWVGADTRLGPAARRLLERFEAGAATVYVPSPALAELASLEKRGKLRVQTSFRRWWGTLEAAGVVGLPLTPEDVLLARELDWDHTDPFDRLVVATAVRLGLPLMTSDRVITDWGGVEVIW